MSSKSTESGGEGSANATTTTVESAESNAKDNAAKIWASLKAPIVKQIACGKDRTLLLLETGELYSWELEDGKKSFVHLVDKYSTVFGTALYGNRKQFLASDNFISHRVVRIAAGSSHYCALTDEAMWNLYTWGNNDVGQLGLGDIYEDREHLSKMYFEHPTRVWSRALSHRVKDVICGDTFTVCTLANEDVYGFGVGEPLKGPRLANRGGRRGRNWFGSTAAAAAGALRSKRAALKQEATSAWFSPKPLVLNMSTYSMAEFSQFLRDSDRQCTWQKEEIKRLIACAIAQDESNTYTKAIGGSTGRREDVDGNSSSPASSDRNVWTNEYNGCAYALQVRVKTQSGDDRKVLVYLSKSESVGRAKMKAQAELHRAKVEKISKMNSRSAIGSSSDKRAKGGGDTGEKNKKQDDTPPQSLIVLPLDQLWLGCAQQELQNNATFDSSNAGSVGAASSSSQPSATSAAALLSANITKATSSSSSSHRSIESHPLLVDTAFAPAHPFHLTLEKEIESGGGSDQMTIALSLHDTPTKVLEAICGKHDLKHGKPPPMRLHRPHLRLAANGNYMYAWTTPFELEDGVDALTHRELLDASMDDATFRFWDYRCRMQQTALDAACGATSTSLGAESALKEHNVRNRYMNLSINMDIFIRRAQSKIMMLRARLQDVRNDILSQRDRIREERENFETQKRQLCGDIDKDAPGADIRSMSDPVSKLLMGMRAFPAKPTSEKVARRKGDGYCASIWSTYRHLKTSALKRGDHVYVFNTIGNPTFMETGVRKPFAISEIRNPAPFSPADKIMQFLESIGLNKSSDTVRLAMTLCGGLDAVLCAISRELYINPPPPDASGGVQRLEIFSSRGNVTYNEFTDWVLRKRTPYGGPDPRECTFCPDRYYHKAGGIIHTGKIPFEIVEATILNIRYTPISNKDINEADETPHPFLHPPSSHLYKVQLTSGQRIVLDNLQPRMLDLVNPKISRPGEAEFYTFLDHRIKVNEMLAEINGTYREYVSRELELKRLSSEEIGQNRLLAKANTEIFVLQRMRLRLGRLLNQELDLQISELREELTQLMYDGFFRVRYLNDFETYMQLVRGSRDDADTEGAATGKVASGAKRASAWMRRDIFKITSKDRSRELQRMHFETMLKRATGAEGEDEEELDVKAPTVSSSHLSLADIDAKILESMCNNIDKEIASVRKKMTSERFERHSFNAEGFSVVAGFHIFYHWNIVVSRACKRDMLRRILSTPVGDTVRWSFIDDLEALLETSATSTVPEIISIRKMRSEFLTLLKPGAVRRPFFARTYVHESFVNEVVGNETHFKMHELDPLELVLSRVVITNQNTRLLDVEALVDCIGDCAAELRAVIYEEDVRRSSNVDALDVMSMMKRQALLKAAPSSTHDLKLFACTKSRRIQPGCDGNMTEWTTFSFPSPIHIDVAEGETKTLWIGLHAGHEFGSRPRVCFVGEPESCGLAVCSRINYANYFDKMFDTATSGIGAETRRGDMRSGRGAGGGGIGTGRAGAGGVGMSGSDGVGGSFSRRVVDDIAAGLPPKELTIQKSKSTMLDGDLGVIAFHGHLNRHLLRVFECNAKLRQEMNKDAYAAAYGSPGLESDRDPGC